MKHGFRSGSLYVIPKSISSTALFSFASLLSMWLKFSSAGENEMWNRNLLHYYDCISVLCVVSTLLSMFMTTYLMMNTQVNVNKHGQSHEMKAHIHWHIFVLFLLRWLGVGGLKQLLGFIQAHFSFILYGFFCDIFHFTLIPLTVFFIRAIKSIFHFWALMIR